MSAEREQKDQSNRQQSPSSTVTSFSLESNDVTREQLYDSYFAGTSDGWMQREEGWTNSTEDIPQNDQKNRASSEPKQK